MSTAIQSKPRETKTRSALSALRNEGYIPSVVYGYKTESTPIAVKERDLMSTLRETGRNGVIKLDVNGEQLNVVLSDYQEDALKGEIRHADFLAINMTEELEVDVTVNLVGESLGQKEGGVLQQPNHEVKIKVKPSDIPEAFDVDISGLQIGESITVGDIRAKSKFEIMNEDDFGLVVVSSPRSEDTDGDNLPDAESSPELVGGNQGDSDEN
ncbi:50S ribosomal protein L25/general stress protein Ctc [Sporosarcina thermotolerans]|uniref:Large ribosomal subunit protein bL25 n=1 Tax=Sporosarcina thermotolerans TaxID=633404 RepID=A0AAW9ADL8_9BACL|nr:50S ribosomal protein L25/general stress protein Ctc [Sporosarcina thermotolerans]MDW0118688.1 50S ribosomal protein L25/general stress protein Ctc [Sporosarcina thermotolerans]